jgi:predicted ATPase/DNA-binding SARP family transcriptional activator
MPNGVRSGSSWQEMRRMALRFGVLGPLEVSSDSETIPVRGAKRRGVLTYLLAHVGEPQSSDRIVDAVWAETASSGSVATVQTYVSQLRKLFGEEDRLLTHRAGGYVLDLTPDALDASRFEAAVAAASALDDGDHRLALLDEALELWRGPPLDEFAGQAWADERARQWTRLHVLAHQLRVDALLDAGRHRDALPTLEQLVAAHPLHEPFWAQLVVARYRCGQQAGALAAVGEARKVLATELGIEPGPELIELERNVLAHDPVLEAPAQSQQANNASVVTIVDPLPDGVVTFFLTDIVGSTELWDRYPEDMAKALVRHEDVIGDVVRVHAGRLLKSRGEGDATLSVFARTTDAVAAAVALQRRLANEAWPGGLGLPTRIALHTGEAHLRNGDYYGGTLNRAARIRGLATGGQVLVSRAVHDLVVDVLDADVQLVGIGEHEMKGLQRREAVYALDGPGLAATLPDSLDAPIPRPRTSFIGRELLVSDIERLLRQPGVTTLVGPGGIGKTRLAFESAARIAHRFDFVRVVELASVTEADAVPPHLASVLGVSGPTDLTASIVAALRSNRVLLVIDNCEHLVDEAARLIGRLARSVSSLTVLATSRVGLDIPEETVVAVAPLVTTDAVRLLIDRSGRRPPDVGSREDDNLTEIARRLDGIPLALELTGARLRSMPASALVARLPILDVPARRPATDRHATMRAALDWSYELLNEQEQAVLRRLSAFAGFTIESAEQVVPGRDGDVIDRSSDISELLGRLVLNSFVEFDDSTGRYRLLEPVRQFSGELMEREREDVATRDRHAKHFAEVAERVSRAMTVGQQAQSELDQDEGNIEAALTWTDERHDDEVLCRIVGALGFFWYLTNTEQGIRWSERVVALRRDVSQSLWASVLLTAGQLAQAQYRNDGYGEGWLDEAITIYGELGRTRALAWALFWRGRVLLLSEPLASKDNLEEALAKFRACDDALGIGWALYFLGGLAYEAADDDRYDQLAAELGDYGSVTGLPVFLGLAREREAFVALHRGAASKAREFTAAAVAYQRRGDRYNLVSALTGMAWIESQVGSKRLAFESLKEALELGQGIGAMHERDSATLIAAAMLVDAGAENEAREVLHAAGFLRGPRFQPLGTRWLRERASYIEEHVDITKPIAHRFRDATAASEWILQWIADQLETCEHEVSEGRAANAGVDVDARSQPAIAPSVAPRSFLIGRTDVLTAVADALLKPGLVTLVGPGGIGKTRLLEEASERFGSRFERVWRVDLVGARDRAGVEDALAEALLPAPDPLMEPTNDRFGGDVLAEIASRIASRRSLLALDNCEQLLDILPQMVEALLRGTPSLTILATSREQVGAHGELAIRIVPLDVPSGDALTDPSPLAQVESVQLLVERARERGAAIAVTVENAHDVVSICRQLDGIPLALELAAARLASTSLRDLAARLPRQLQVLVARDSDARHRTLHNAVDWSYQLLESPQQLLLRRLGIFVGGFTLEAAEQVCSGDASDELPSADAVYLNLSELVAKSLVMFSAEQGRYRMLEPIRQFARRGLEDSPEFAAVAVRHAGWVSHIARATLAAQMAGDSPAGDRFQVELDNAHAALSWLDDSGEHRAFLLLVATLGFTWFQTDWRRGRATANRALDLAGAAPPRLRAAVLLARGMVEQRCDLAGSAVWLREAHSIYREWSDPAGVAWSVFFLGRSYLQSATGFGPHLLEAAERFHELGFTTGEGWSFLNLGVDANVRGRLDDAQGYLQSALTIAKQSGQTALLSIVVAELGTNALERGDAEKGCELLREAVVLQEKGGDRWNSVGLLTQAAWAEVVASNLDLAEEVALRATRIGLDVDDVWQVGEALLVLAVARAQRGDEVLGRGLLAATGWDVAPPQHLVSRERTVYALALRKLADLLPPAPDDAVGREARGRGIMETAKLYLRDGTLLAHS